MSRQIGITGWTDKIQTYTRLNNSVDVHGQTTDIHACDSGNGKWTDKLQTLLHEVTLLTNFIHLDT